MPVLSSNQKGDYKATQLSVIYRPSANLRYESTPRRLRRSSLSHCPCSATQRIMDTHSLEYLAVLATLCQSFEGEPTQFGDSLPLLHYSFCGHSCLAQLINISSSSRSRSSCDKNMFRNEPKFWIWER